MSDIEEEIKYYEGLLNENKGKFDYPVYFTSLNDYIEHIQKVLMRLYNLKSAIKFEKIEEFEEEKKDFCNATVYFIKPEKQNCFKVGKSSLNGWKERIKQIQTGSPYKIELYGLIFHNDNECFRVDNSINSNRLEGSIHKFLRNYIYNYYKDTRFKHLSGEWYEGCVFEVMDLIEKFYLIKKCNHVGKIRKYEKLDGKILLEAA